MHVVFVDARGFIKMDGDGMSLLTLELLFVVCIKSPLRYPEAVVASMKAQK